MNFNEYQQRAWKTALARKPLSEKTVAENVLEYGTGGLNIDGCRIPTQDNLNGGMYSDEKNKVGGIYGKLDYDKKQEFQQPVGRFPANLIHDGSDEVLGLFPESKSTGGSGENSLGGLGDSGSAARFFYCAKASKSERDAGLDGVPETTKVWNGQSEKSSEEIKDVESRWTTKLKNTHPTVKPIELMKYLIKLITPPNGIVLDPFCGSGSTLVAARQLGFKAIGIEMDEKYCEIVVKRCLAEHQQNLC